MTRLASTFNYRIPERNTQAGLRKPYDTSRVSLLSRDFLPSIEDLVVVRLEVRDDLCRRLFHGFRPLLL